MSMSGGPSTASVKAGDLQELGNLVAERRPWYEALGMTAEKASGILGEDAKDYVSEQGLGLGRKVAELLLSAADVDALKPVCVVFKALFDAVKGAATNRDDLIDLIGYGVRIVKSIPETGATSGLPPAVKGALEDFGKEVESVMQLAGRFSVMQQPTARRRFWRRAKEVVNHAEINKAIKGHVTQFERIVNVLTMGAAFQSAIEIKAVRDELPKQRTAASKENVEVKALVAQEHQNTQRKVDDLGEKVDGLTLLTNDLRPSCLPELAAVPLGAPPLGDTYVPRVSLLKSAIDCITNPRLATGPCVLAGLGGGGKSVLASAVVRDEKVREHFRAGIFWLTVGRGAKRHIGALFQGLAREVGVAPTDTPHGVPRELDSLEKTVQYLMAVAGTKTRLVVLDNVWEREVVDTLLPTGFQLLVTTRNRDDVGPGGLVTEVGDMSPKEALELLRLASGAVQPLPEQEASRVVKDCGFLPLAVAVIGAMDESRAFPRRPDTWTKVHEKLSAKPEFVYEEGLDNGSGNVLELSFSALDADAKERFRRLGVLAVGALVSMEMLSYLWDQGSGNSKLFVGQLVGRSLVQVVEYKYRLHDLVLAFAKNKLRCLKMGRVALVTSRQAQYLSRLSVLREYAKAGEMLGGFYALIGLWASVEELSRDSTLQTTMYRAILCELEESEATADMLISYQDVGRLFHLQGKYKEAGSLAQRALAIAEKVYGPDHPSLATTLNNRAGLLESQEKYTEAIPLLERALSIRTKKLGGNHPYTVSTQNSLELVRKKV